MDSIYNWLPDRTGKTPQSIIIVGNSAYTGMPDNDYAGSNKGIIAERDINWRAQLFTSGAQVTGDGGGCKIITDRISIPAEQKSFSVYPNPTKGIITIQASDEIVNHKLLITDITGRLIQEDRVTNSRMTLDLGNLPKGMYLISIDETQKLIVE